MEQDVRSWNRRLGLEQERLGVGKKEVPGKVKQIVEQEVKEKEEKEAGKLSRRWSRMTKRKRKWNGLYSIKLKNCRFFKLVLVLCVFGPCLQQFSQEDIHRLQFSPVGI